MPIIGELSKFITRPICFPNNEYWYEICSEYKIPSTNLYDWRDRVLARLKDLFVEESESARKQRILAQEIESLYQYSLLGRQMEHVINLLNSPVIGKKSSFSFVLLLTGLGIT